MSTVEDSTRRTNNGDEQSDSPAPPATVAPAASQPTTIQLDDSKAVVCYANFCRVTGTPEEMIIDFALNPQPFGPPAESIVVHQRIVTNYFTAKRLCQALIATVQRHEAAFGVLETDVQKRVSSHLRG